MVLKYKGYTFTQIKRKNVYQISNDKRVVLLSACNDFLTEEEAKEAIEAYIRMEDR